MGLFDRLKGRSDRRTETRSHEVLMPQRNAPLLIAEGNSLEDAGKLEEALARYEAAIVLAPSLARAHLNRGNALLALGDVERAIAVYATALRFDSNCAAAHYNLGNAYVRLNRLSDAIPAYLKALDLTPEFVDAEVALGTLYSDLGQLEDAVSSYRRALEISPTYAAVHVNLGNALQALGQLEQSVSSYRHALQLDPRVGMAHYGLGHALYGLGRYGEAMNCFSRTLQITPDFALAHWDLGNTQRALGKMEEAVGSYLRASKIMPGSAPAHYDLGIALHGLAQTQDAIASFRHALRIEPNHVNANCMLGNLLADEGNLFDAIGCYRRMLEVEPKNVLAHNNIGNAFRRLGQMADAMVCYESAIEIDPDLAAARSNLLFIHNSLQDLPASELLAEAQQFGELTARRGRPFTAWTNVPAPDRPLRVGLVSGDFRNHPVASFLESLLAEFASNEASCRLEFCAFSNHALADDVTSRIMSLCRAWYLVSDLTDEALAQQIRDDGIDILIDLSGHTGHNRLQMFALKPAPVQVTWLGYLATTGMKEIDYLIADEWTLPETEEIHFTEKIWRLPESYICSTSPANVDVGTLPALTEKHVTFGCFNNLTKIGDAVVALWARVLNAIPDSRLYLKTMQLKDASARETMVERFARHGIDSGRLILEGLAPRAEYLLPFRRIDIALDPFPYPGITTSVESLWMGVPVLTLAGQSFLSRQGVGLLMNAGLPDWIAQSEDEYVASAVSHCSDLARLAVLRSELRQKVLKSPIFDAPRYARNFEMAMRGMWHKWCRMENATVAPALMSQSS